MGIKYRDLFNCPKCGGATNTYRHPYAKVWCPNCGFVLRNEGDQTIQHKANKNNSRSTIVREANDLPTDADSEE